MLRYLGSRDKRARCCKKTSSRLSEYNSLSLPKRITFKRSLTRDSRQSERLASSLLYFYNNRVRIVERVRAYARKHFLAQKYTRRGHLRYERVSAGGVIFTIIVVTDKPVAFPRRLIISRRKRKGLSRAPAQPLLVRHYTRARVSTYVLSRTPETRYYWITFLIRPLSAASAATHSL